MATSNAFIIFIVKDSQSVFLKFCRAIKHITNCKPMVI